MQPPHQHQVPQGVGSIYTVPVLGGSNTFIHVFAMTMQMCRVLGDEHTFIIPTNPNMAIYFHGTCIAVSQLLPCYESANCCLQTLAICSFTALSQPTLAM